MKLRINDKYDAYLTKPFRLEKISPEATFEEMKSQLYSGIVQILQEQLENNGPSFFLDVSTLQTTQGAVLIGRILERRKEKS